jgi:hypothetical protein
VFIPSEPGPIVGSSAFGVVFELGEVGGAQGEFGLPVGILCPNQGCIASDIVYGIMILDSLVLSSFSLLRVL